MHYYLIIIAAFFPAGFVLGKICRKLGFTGIEGFFWFRGSTSLMAFLGLIFFTLMIFLTHYFFPLAVLLTVVGFLKGISRNREGFGENLEDVENYNIIGAAERSNSKQSASNPLNANAQKKAVKSDIGKIDWPDLNDL